MKYLNFPGYLYALDIVRADYSNMVVYVAKLPGIYFEDSRFERRELEEAAMS
ncbi:MAG: hypothetical protein QXU72_03950 [Thermofilum sp.]